MRCAFAGARVTRNATVFAQRRQAQLLLNYLDTDNVIVKFVLNTKNIRDEAMSYFHVTNINESTLFPGMDGMARSLAYELEYHWAYNPKTMVRNAGYEDPPFGLPVGVIV